MIRVSLMKANNQFKQITVILPKGKGLPIIKRLRKDKEIVSANRNYARGVGRMTPLRYRGVGEQTEKEIVNVIVSADKAEDIFEFIYDVAEINNPHAGILYMISLSAANQFVLPGDIPEED